MLFNKAKDFADVVRVPNHFGLKLQRLSWLSRWAQCKCINKPFKAEEEGRRVSERDSKHAKDWVSHCRFEGGRAKCQGNRKGLNSANKRHELESRFFPKPPEKSHPADTSILKLRDSRGLCRASLLTPPYTTRRAQMRGL